MAADVRVYRQEKPLARREGSVYLTESMASQRVVSTFGRWISERKLTNTLVARELGVSKALVGDWLAGNLTPGAFLRLKIERWTGGAIKAVDWLSEEERAALKALKPFKAISEAAA